jgi:hypothetical protein
MAQSTTNTKPKSGLLEHSETKNADVYGYIGLISEQYAMSFIGTVIANKPRKPNIVLFISTHGGDPDAAYKIARNLRRLYKRITLVIVGPCKSAGTLIAVGADELVFGPFGELGPLDVQLRKPDDLFTMRSGLDTLQGFALVSKYTFESFENYFLQIISSSGGRISTRTAAEVATQLSSGLVNPIAAQIDPHSLGEVERRVNIARAYGDRLKSDNLKEDALNELVSSYPSHSFVIDIDEAKELFNNVRPIDASESKAMVELGGDSLGMLLAPQDHIILDGPSAIRAEQQKNEASNGSHKTAPASTGGSSKAPRGEPGSGDNEKNDTRGASGGENAPREAAEVSPGTDAPPSQSVATSESGGVRNIKVPSAPPTESTPKRVATPSASSRRRGSPTPNSR